MFNKFKKGHTVIVHGPGQKSEHFYKNIPAIIVERDPYFKDYCVKFQNGIEDWILPKYLREPYIQNKKRSIKK